MPVGAFFKKTPKEQDPRSSSIHYNRQTSSSHDEDDDIMLRKRTLGSRYSEAYTTVSTPIIQTWQFLRKWTNLTVWIIVGLVVGILIGKFSPDFAVKIGPLGAVFIRLIQCIVGPLIFSTLVVGIAGHGNDLIRVGRLALKSVIYFEVVTTLALILGLIAVNIVHPGSGFDMKLLPQPDRNFTQITWVTEMDLIVPTSFFLALSDHTAVLAVVFCAIMFSVAITRIDDRSKRFLLDFNLSLSNAMFKIVDLVMNYAPIGIACSLAATVGEYGLEALEAAGRLVLTLYITLILFAILILLPIVWILRFPLKDYLRAVSQPFLMAFATSSSESALPKAMENMVEFGVPPEIAAFVIPTGYSFNLDGSTLYLSVAVMFCAQVAGVHKSVGEQIAIMLTLMLTSKGVAAVPRASYIVLASALDNSNIPLAPLALILAVDAFMDMARTSVNVLGNMTACAVIAKWEGEFRNEVWRARAQGQQPETLPMDDLDRDRDRLGSSQVGGGFEMANRSTSILPLHSGPMDHHMIDPYNQHQFGAGLGSVGGVDPTSGPIGGGGGGGGNRGFNSEKMSIHSVQSVVSNIDQPYHMGGGSSASGYHNQGRQQYGNQFQGMSM